MRKFALIALLTTIASWGNAQRTSLPIAHHHPIHSSAFFFADPFYSDALNREGPFPASQPTVIVLQAAPAPVPDPPSKPTQPLMIELQAGRYVRVSGEESSNGETETKLIDSATVSRAPAFARSQKPQAEMRSAAVPNPAPAILVFRDGHHEDVSEYTIADGNLYTHGDYYTSGSWNKKIDLSSLNLPDTITANQSRGIKFQLPSAPNEVIVRP
jgi:hypothetical protein